MAETDRNLEKTPVESIILQLQEHHRNQLDICNRLENLADSLPDNVDRQECLSISWQIYPAIKSAHQFEEETLFPTLQGTQGSSADIDRNIERLKFEHWEDESSAEDISIFLRQMVQSPKDANVGKISYMLRGFFEGLRRHIAFESEHLLPMLRELH